MVRGQIGTEIGVQAVGNTAGGAAFPGMIADITADGVNTITVSVAQARSIRLGTKIDIMVKATGAALATGRTVTGVDQAGGVITYSGADVTAVAGTHGVYPTGGWRAPIAAGPSSGPTNSNLNGGSDQAGWDSVAVSTVQSMRDRLQAINATTYADAELDKMTYNDLVYAIRVNDYPGTIK